MLCRGSRSDVGELPFKIWVLVSDLFCSTTCLISFTFFERFQTFKCDLKLVGVCEGSWVVQDLHPQKRDHRHPGIWARVSGIRDALRELIYEEMRCKKGYWCFQRMQTGSIGKVRVVLQMKTDKSQKTRSVAWSRCLAMRHSCRQFRLVQIRPRVHRPLGILRRQGRITSTPHSIKTILFTFNIVYCCAFHESLFCRQSAWESLMTRYNHSFLFEHHSDSTAACHFEDFHLHLAHDGGENRRGYDVARGAAGADFSFSSIISS